MISRWPVAGPVARRTTWSIKSFVARLRHISCLARSPIDLSAQISPTQSSGEHENHRTAKPPRPSCATSRDFQTHDVRAHAPPPHSPSLYCFRPPRTRVLTLSAVLHAVMKLLRLCLSNKMATAYVPNDISTARFAHMNTQLVSFILHRSSIEWYVDGRVKRKLVQSLVHTSCAITMFSVESAVYYPLTQCCNCGYLGTARSQQLDGV